MNVKISIASILVVLFLLTLIPVTCFAFVNTPWNNSDYGINVIYTDNFTPSTAVAWEAVKSPSSALSDTSSLIGWGFYFENNTNYAVSVNPSLYIGGSTSPCYIAANMPVTLITKGTNAEMELTSNASRYFNVPKGFNGYIVIPLSSMSLTAGAFSITNFGFKTNLVIDNSASTQILINNVFVYGNIESQNANDILDETFNPVLRFTVMGDAHFSAIPNDASTQKFASAMSELYAIAENHSTYKTIDALVFVGDMVDDRTDACYTTFKNALAANVKEETQILACLGNHEYFRTISGDDMCDTQIAAAQLQKHLGIDNIDTAVKINGYYFILSSLRHNVNNGLWWNDTENLNWLEEKVSTAAAEDPKKPIFTFAHVGFANTIAETSSNQFYNDAGFGAPYNIYKNYSQIVNFAGHTHHPLNFDNSIHQKDFTNVASGHLRSGAIASGDGSTLGTSTSQCILVEVDAKNSVRIRRYDILNKRFMGDSWIIATPSDKNSFTYTDSRSELTEAFILKDAASVTAVSTNSITLSIPSAANINTYYYKVDAYKNNSLVKSQYIPSLIWNSPKPASVEAIMSGLNSDTEYTFKITAYDSYFNNSNTITCSSKTKPPIKTPFTDKSLKVNVYDDLNLISAQDITINFETASADENDSVLWCGDGLKSNAVIKTGNGEIVVTSNPGTWVGAVKLAYGNELTDTAGVKGLGFYVENNLSVNANITPVFFGNKYILCKPGESILAVNTYGDEEVLAVTAGRYVSLKAGFKGWLFLPLDSLVDAYSSQPLIPGDFTLTNISLKFGTSFSSGDIKYDNFFVYGDVTENNDNLIVLTKREPSFDTMDNTAMLTAVLLSLSSACYIICRWYKKRLCRASK